jgi:hypothetical protein
MPNLAQIGSSNSSHNSIPWNVLSHEIRGTIIGMRVGSLLGVCLVFSANKGIGIGSSHTRHITIGAKELKTEVSGSVRHYPIRSNNMIYHNQ